jgi:hypothetical protein
VLEPIFEADLDPSAHGYRPGRGAADAIKCQRRLDAPRFCRSKIPQARAIGDQPVW